MEAFAMNALGLAEYCRLKHGQMKEAQKRVKQMEKELQKKEKAFVGAATFLLLRKKV